MDLGNLIGMLAATELVEVDGLTIGYHRAGFGPALVLLHGYVGDGLATWRPQIEGLSDELTVIAWDAPGAGRSSDPPDQFGMAGYADCLRTVIDRLGLDRPHVAGLSFGGALAIEFSRRHPAIPRSLILASVYAGLAGSLPVDVVDQRLNQAIVLADLSSDEFVATLLPTMFTERTPGRYRQREMRTAGGSRPLLGRWAPDAPNQTGLPKITGTRGLDRRCLSRSRWCRMFRSPRSCRHTTMGVSRCVSCDDAVKL